VAGIKFFFTHRQPSDYFRSSGEKCRPSGHIPFGYEVDFGFPPRNIGHDSSSFLLYTFQEIITTPFSGASHSVFLFFLNQARLPGPHPRAFHGLLKENPLGKRLAFRKGKA